MTYTILILQENRPNISFDFDAETEADARTKVSTCSMIQPDAIFNMKLDDTNVAFYMGGKLMEIKT